MYSYIKMMHIKTLTVSSNLWLGWGASQHSPLWSFPAGFDQPPVQSEAACPCMYPRWGSSPPHHWPETHTHTVILLCFTCSCVKQWSNTKTPLYNISTNLSVAEMQIYIMSKKSCIHFNVAKSTMILTINCTLISNILVVSAKVLAKYFN